MGWTGNWGERINDGGGAGVGQGVGRNTDFFLLFLFAIPYPPAPGLLCPMISPWVSEDAMKSDKNKEKMALGVMKKCFFCRWGKEQG